MSYLADTDILIWALNHPDRLSPSIARCLGDPTSQCFYSGVSLWEIALKCHLGKLNLRGHTPEEFLEALDNSFFEPLPLDNQTIASSHRLPRLHGDPFDRLLVWQAISGGQTLLSADQATDQYIPWGLSVTH